MQKFALPICLFSLVGVIIQFKQPLNSSLWAEPMAGASAESLTQRLIPLLPMPGEKENILVACKTAVGDQNAQFGFAGMAVQSGVKTVVASLWYVSDQGTLGLMTENNGIQAPSFQDGFLLPIFQFHAIIIVDIH